EGARVINLGLDQARQWHRARFVSQDVVLGQDRGVWTGIADGDRVFHRVLVGYWVMRVGRMPDPITHYPHCTNETNWSEIGSQAITRLPSTDLRYATLT